MSAWLGVLRQLLADRELAVPIWKPEISSRSELDAQALHLPLVVVWGVKDAGAALDMTISVNVVRLESELRQRLPGDVPSAEWDRIMDMTQECIGRYAQEFLANLVDTQLPVPLCLEQDARQVLLKPVA